MAAGLPDTGCEGKAVEAIVARIQSRYDAISDLTADFVQSSEAVMLSGASLGGEPETSRGSVVFAKPGRMRWAYEEPEPSFVISDGHTLWVYDVAARQASKLDVEGGYLAGAALQFLLGEGRLADSFHVVPERCDPKQVVLELFPREPASYERLGMTADAETGLVIDTTIVDLFGNRTRIRFENVKLDRSPDASLFRFEPPEGVEVMDLRPPG